MSATDDRVVRMQLNNTAFERAAQMTLNTLDKLKRSLNFGAPKNGLDSVQKTANNFNMNPMTSALDGVSKKFLALSTIGLTALSNITTKAVDAGLRVAKSLTIAPIADGFHEYETQLNSVQTILANTGLKGASGMGQVNKALNDLNTYSDKTIYNFSEMARNIGTFTAAGVKLGPATSSIKGIANVAALSGSNSEQASTAMYQLSQAIANNKVGLQDWNSVVNAGMGGKVMQEALFNMGKMQGTLKGVKANETFDQWTKSGNSFRESLKDGWITGDVLTSTLKAFTLEAGNSYSKAQVQALKAKGFSDAQIKSMQDQARLATDAATKVKTFTQLMGTLKEAVGSGWAQSFGIIFGNFDEAKTLWTGVSNSIGTLISNSSKARNKVLGDWKALGGRTQLIKGIQAAFTALGSVIKPIKQAFRDIIPAATGKTLYDLTVKFTHFMQSLKLSDKTAYDLWRTFRGVFAIFDIGKQIVSGIFHLLGTLFHTVTSGSGSFLVMTGNVGDFLVKLDDALKKGGAIKTFFDKLGGYLSVPIMLLQTLRNAVFGMFDGFNSKDASNLSDGLGRIKDRLASLTGVGQRIKTFFSSFWKQIQPGVQAIENAFSKVWDAVANAFKSGDFSHVLDAVNTGLLAGIALMIRKFFKSGFSVDIGHGAISKIGEAFEGLTGNLKAMQQQTKANTLLKIAGAIALLTVSVVALSLINSAKLSTALKAMAVGFGELLGAMAVLSKIGGGIVKMPVIAASLDLLAGAILLLTASVVILAQMSWDQLKKGLSAVGILLAAISAAAIPLSMNSAGLVRAGIGISAIGVALNILFLAVKEFSTLNWSEMIKGLTGVAGVLAAVALGAQLMPKNMIAIGLGLLEISVALNVMYKAVSSFAQLSWKEMLKGLTGVAGALVVIAGAMHLMPKGMIAQAAALVIVGAALNVIAKAVASMGQMSWKEIGKGLATLAGAMLILVVALNSLDGALPGAAAMVIVSGALMVLSQVIKTFGGMSWTDLAKGLLAMAASFAVIGVAGLLMAPVVPILLALGAALTLLGAGFALFGVGAMAIAGALSILSTVGAEGVKILLMALEGLIKALPGLAIGLADGLIAFVVEVGKNMPALVGAVGQIVTGILKVLVDNVPNIVQAAINLVVALLQGLADNAPRLIGAAANLIVQFLQGISDNLPKVIQAGFDFIISFLNGLATAIDNNSQKVVDAMGRVGMAILRGLWRGISSLAGWVWDQISGFFSWLWDQILGFFGIHSPSRLAADLGGNIIRGLWNGISSLGSWIADLVTGFFKGIWSIISNIFSGAWQLGKMLLQAIWNGISSLGSWLGTQISNIFHGVLSAIGSIFSGALDIGKNLVKAIWNGISSLGGWLKDSIKGLIDGIMGAFSSMDGFGIGGNMIQGVIDGVNGKKPSLDSAAVDAAQGFIGAFVGHMQIKSPSRVMMRIGGHIMGGLVKGIDDNADGPAKAAVNASNNIIKSIHASLDQSSDFRPTITPVLDLSLVHKGSAELNNLVKDKSVRPTVSLGHAKHISDTKIKATAAERAGLVDAANALSINLTQNNHSPTALSTADIYRNTRNQMAMAKSALGLS